MRLTILNDTSQRDGCSWCSTTWSTPQDIAFILDRLVERYGDRVDVAYVDLAQGALDDGDRQIIKLARERGLPLPIVAIDGSVKLIGAADYRAIAEAIEVQCAAAVSVRGGSPNRRADPGAAPGGHPVTAGSLEKRGGE